MRDVSDIMRSVGRVLNGISRLFHVLSGSLNGVARGNGNRAQAGQNNQPEKSTRYSQMIEHVSYSVIRGVPACRSFDHPTAAPMIALEIRPNRAIYYASASPSRITYLVSSARS